MTEDTQLGRRGFAAGMMSLLATPPAMVLSTLARANEQVTLDGVGASVPHRLYRAWADELGPEIGLSMSYIPLGSGAGREAAKDRTADFGASDIALSDHDLAQASLLQVPSAYAALGFAVNLPGLDVTELQIGRNDLAAIFCGEIRVWSDERLQARNPGIDLPHLAITPVIRQESSGSTSFVSGWLEAAEAPSGRCSAPLANVPGLSVFGTRGVAQTIKRIRGSIGYLEMSTARQFSLDTLPLETDGGTYARFPGLDGASISPIVEVGEPAWPMLIRTHILIPTELEKRDRSSLVALFFRTCLLEGGEIAQRVGFVKLPETEQQLSVEILERFCECR